MDPQFVHNPAFNIILVVVAIWTLLWKIPALWLTAKNDQKKWFTVLLVINTLGILEIIYLFKVAKKNSAEIKEVLASFKRAWTRK